MTAAARSSSSAPSRSEQRTRSTSHRPGAICASDVTRGAGGEAASGGGAAGAGGGVGCCGADDCAHAARQHANRTATKSLFIIVPLSNDLVLWLWLPAGCEDSWSSEPPTNRFRSSATRSLLQ